MKELASDGDRRPKRHRWRRPGPTVNIALPADDDTTDSEQSDPEVLAGAGAP